MVQVYKKLVSEHSEEDEEDDAWVQCERRECRKWRRIPASNLAKLDKAEQW